MSDTAQGPVDLDTLTDDEVMALSPDQIQALMNQEGEEDVQPEINDEPAGDPADDAPDGADPDAAAAEPEGSVEDPAPEDAANAEPGEGEPETPAAAEEDDKPAEGTPEGSDPASEAEKAPEAAKEDAPVDPKAKKPEADDKTKGDEPDVKAATDFYAEITKPFKADGKDFQVKTAAEAIRLMQMGANYSRRMQEMKPLKAMDAVLKEHGLNDPAKLAQLIDIQKGDPAAIQKLLKDKGIDPLDIDVSKDATYAAKPYTADEKSLNFQEAITTTLQVPGGKELIADMHGNWDEKSKDALYEQPQIFENLLAQKSAGDYEKINAEVERQRVLGYLTDVPFLQAYTDVSNAMENLGLLSTAKKTTPAVPKAPIDTGTRKAAEPKTPAPNPNLSSTPPKAAPSPAAPTETDYSALSDEDFLKLGAPT